MGPAKRFEAYRSQFFFYDFDDLAVLTTPVCLDLEFWRLSCRQTRHTPRVCAQSNYGVVHGKQMELLSRPGALPTHFNYLYLILARL